VEEEQHQVPQPLEELTALTRQMNGNIDYIQGVLFPSQTYAFSGRQWGSSQEAAEASKRPANSSPMIITSQPPGAFASSDSSWSLTFGASHDAWLTLFNSRFMADSQPVLTEDVFGKGMPTARDFNLYKLANEVQQITYVANKNTVEEFRNDPKAADEFAARGLGIRMPMMAAGYGKTTALLPTDPEPEDARKNDESHKLARETWKHGPVDLRWNPLTGMWSGWNDLITGQGYENLGTWVFGTNNNEDEGFPFLRGKLQDVWWVRKTQQFDGISGREDDYFQTGEVLTVLEHRFYDEATKACAPLSSIFTIPGTDHADCHPDTLHTTTLGDEETHDALLIDLKSSVHFNMAGTDNDGPLNFTTQDIPPDEMCSPSDGKYHLGTLFFNDDGCVWDFAVKIDECELNGGHFERLASNDVSIAERMTFFCNMITSWGGDGGTIPATRHSPPGYSLPQTQDINFGSVASIFECFHTNIEISNLNAIQNATNNDAAVYDALAGYAEALAQSCIAQVNTWISSSLIPALIACCGEGGGSVGTITPEFPNPTPPGGVTREIPEYIECELSLLPAPRLNCEYCAGVHLNVPCGETPSVFAGDGCIQNDPPVPVTAYGNCQSHS